MTRRGTKLIFLFEETAGGSGNRRQWGPEVVGNRTEDGIAHPFCLHRNVRLLRFFGQTRSLKREGDLICKDFQKMQLLCIQKTRGEGWTDRQHADRTP